MTDEVIHDLRDAGDVGGRQVKAHDVVALDVQKRLRVLEFQLLEEVIEDLNASNHQFHLRTFMKQCDNLGKKFPIMEELGYIDMIRIKFWTMYQHALKTKLKKR